MAVPIPAFFFDIPYKGACYPGSPKVGDFREGANCQVFAYQLLAHFGYPLLPDFRSSELWDDVQHTTKVTTIAPFDLLFWNSSAQTWGAHIGVALGDGTAIHLARAQGRAAIWPLERFGETPAYSFFLGAKRVKSSVLLEK